MNDIASLGDTIAPKSDQLNADDLISGPITVQITNVKRGDSAEQPISVEIDGDRQPYRPCKSMRRVMIAAWGDDGRKWAGYRLTLYCDPDVKFGGVKVGGIRISHMSGINSPLALMLTTTRSKRSEFVVSPLHTIIDEGLLKKISGAATQEGLKAVYASAYREAKKNGEATDSLERAYNTRKTEIEQASSGSAMTYAEVSAALEKATTREDFDAACDLIQHVADLPQREELSAIVKRRLPEFKN